MPDDFKLQYSRGKSFLRSFTSAKKDDLSAQAKRHMSKLQEGDSDDVALLGEEESSEMLRTERWPNAITCPTCTSLLIKKLKKVKAGTSYKYEYQCLSCGETFLDDSGTCMEGGALPIQIWMQCWYLAGCTNSITYIASKLGLEERVVKQMVNQLQKLFQADKPFTRTLEFKDWAKQAQHLEKKIKGMMKKKKDLMEGLDVGGTQPSDTAEYRRQKKRGPKDKV